MRSGIAVVVPVRDAAAHLERCIEALRSQRLPASEIVMVDNGSADASPSIVGRHPEIRFLREPKLGTYAARNRGIAESHDSVIAFTDPDCVVDEQWLAQIAQAMSDPEVEIVLGGRRLLGRSLALSLVAAYEHEKDTFVLTGRLPLLYYGFTNNMAVRRSVFEAVGPFPDLPRGADTVLVRRVVDAYSVDAVRYCPEALVTHLELDGLSSYYRKIFLYGRHRCLNSGIVASRSLDLSQRAEIVRRVARRSAHPAACTAALAALLSVGMVAWWLGTVSARIAVRRDRERR